MEAVCGAALLLVGVGWDAQDGVEGTFVRGVVVSSGCVWHPVAGQGLRDGWSIHGICRRGCGGGWRRGGLVIATMAAVGSIDDERRARGGLHCLRFK